MRNPIAVNFYNQWLTTIQNGESQILDGEIHQEYAWIHPHFLPQHNDLLANPITDILTRSIRGKKQWLVSVYSARDAYYETSNHDSRVRNEIANCFYNP